MLQSIIIKNKSYMMYSPIVENIVSRSTLYYSYTIIYFSYNKL